jgi:hypothetical protein
MPRQRRSYAIRTETFPTVRLLGIRSSSRRFGAPRFEFEICLTVNRGGLNRLHKSVYRA